MERTTEKNLMTYWDTMRGLVSPRECVTATILITEVIKHFNNEDNENSDLIYSALIETADAMKIRNPFEDKDQFQIAYSLGKQFENMDWEWLISKTMAESKDAVLPTALVDMYMERLENKRQTVLLAEAERFVLNLKRIIDASPESSFVLTLQKPEYAMALEYEFEGYQNVEIVTTDIYHYNFLGRDFDVIFSCPAFGVRSRINDETFMCSELEMVALENLSRHLSSGGELVIILPRRITYGPGKVADLRQFIQTNYKIKEIAELPERVIEYTGIKVYLLDIENSKPRDNEIVIRSYSLPEMKTRKSEINMLKIKNDTSVRLSELEKQGDWDINQILSQQDEEYLKFRNSDVPKDELGNVAEVFRGKVVNRKDESGNIGVINISNIGDYEIDYKNLDRMQEDERRVSSYILQEGDLLLPARGTVIRTAVFHEQDFICIASSNVIVIRPNGEVLDSTYLKIFLDSPLGKKFISQKQQGYGVMNIRYTDLNVLEVPLPELSEQQTVAAEYNKELQKYQKTVSDAENRWNKVLNKLQNF